MQDGLLGRPRPASSSQPIDKAPCIGAGVRARRRSIIGVPSVERSGALLCHVDGIDEDRLCHGQNPLVGSELKYVRPLLDVTAVDVGSLLFPMQHQPEFEAWIGDRDVDAASNTHQISSNSGSERFVRRFRFTYSFARRTRDGGHSAVADLKADFPAVETRPLCQVVRFRDLALRENADHVSRYTRNAAPARVPANGRVTNR